MKIRCIAIDDEPPALKLIENFAGKIPFLQLLQTFTHPHEAVSFLRENDVDLVFLDINMPDVNGTALLKEFPSHVMTIFCTAYSDYAVQGFDLNAKDYLVKPFAFERFLEAACKVQEQLMLRKYAQSSGSANDFIFIRSEYSLIRLPMQDILFVEGLKDYIKIVTRNETKPVLSLQSLRSVEAKLPPKMFCRVHRSYIVNLNHISSVQRNIIFIGEREIPVGNQFRDAFFRLIDERTPS